MRFRPLASNGGEQITSTNASKVTLRYYVNGQPATIENLSVQPPLFSTYDLVEKARRGTDTTQFYLSVKDKPLGVLQLRTYIDSSPCDGWVHASEVRFNGKVITSTAAPFYAFELTVP
ncbi:hypothetical protein [uncultured Fibrella sp.]|uniref:hypothetical protein n=1 Tax=uncultured Fibrella sp. TaxID=1284596 RepID=UPI0035CC0664